MDWNFVNWIFVLLQTGINAPRFTNNVKQIVQVRAPQPSKETNKTPAAVVTANSVAPSLAKTLPAKANVIVLHKNSPLVKNMQQQQQQQQQQTLATKVHPFNFNNSSIQLDFIGNLYSSLLGSWMVWISG